MSQTQRVINALWQQGDYQSLEQLLTRQRYVNSGEQALSWSALCARARGDLHASYRFAAPLLDRSIQQDGIMALLGTLGDELKLPQLSLQGWQAAVNANPLQLHHRKALGKYHVNQGNPAMAMAVLEPYRIYHHQDKDGEVAMLPAPGQDESEQGRGVVLEPGTVVLVIPVYEDYEATRTCLERVLRYLRDNRTPLHLLVINDASPNEQLSSWLRHLAAAQDNRFLELLENSTNQGFIRTVNAALSRYPGQDMVLLNADTLVHGNWLDRLHEAAWCDERIGSVTPMSNFGELVSFPGPMRNNPLDNELQVDELDTIAARVNDYAPETIPVGVGFCMYLRRDALNAAGPLNEADYKRGYGEEVDLCLRMAAAGYRNVCAINVYVGHQGSRSFGGEKPLRVAQNTAVLKAQYPAYENHFDTFVFQDHLGPARQRIEADWLSQHQQSWHLVLGSHLGLEDPVLEYARFEFARRGEQLLCLYRDRNKAGLVYRLQAESVPAVQSLCFYMPNEKKALRDLMKTLPVNTVTALVKPPAEIADLLPTVSPAAPARQPAPVLPATGPGPQKVVAVLQGDRPAGEFGLIRQVALHIAQQGLPIRLWLQYETFNDPALVSLGCVDIGKMPDCLHESIHLAAGGATHSWLPNPETDSVQGLIYGW